MRRFLFAHRRASFEWKWALSKLELLYPRPTKFWHIYRSRIVFTQCHRLVALCRCRHLNSDSHLPPSANSSNSRQSICPDLELGNIWDFCGQAKWSSGMRFSSRVLVQLLSWLLAPLFIFLVSARPCPCSAVFCKHLSGAICLHLSWCRQNPSLLFWTFQTIY